MIHSISAVRCRDFMSKKSLDFISFAFSESDSTLDLIKSFDEYSKGRDYEVSNLVDACGVKKITIKVG